MKAGGCPVPSGIPSVSAASSRAAASCGLTGSSIAANLTGGGGAA